MFHEHEDIFSNFRKIEILILYLKYKFLHLKNTVVEHSGLQYSYKNASLIILFKIKLKINSW